MNLFYIRYFVELAKEQQYTKAAKNLNITQPSLSHAIHQLEEELGVLLFEKTGRNTVLTRYGEEFLVYAENTIRTLDQGIRLIRDTFAVAIYINPGE
jgi:DNA-binding transcriptional LysR family regulator